jgi:hypothetical protein
MTVAKKTRTDVFDVGDLVIYKPLSAVKIQLAIVVKRKKLLKLYDILIQTENIYLKDIPIDYIEKIS